jgi:5-formyltetrahydrofolate cyclo-ligase
LKTKQELRKELKTRLASITTSQYDQLSLEVSNRLKEFLNRLGVIQKHLCIAGFAPIEKEPKWYLSLEEDMLSLTAFPAIQNGKMVFKKAQLNELTLKSDFGVKILGPDDSSPEVIPDVILIPGLGFNDKGERLGRGKGFYDRAIKESSAVKIGIAFEAQLDRQIPTDPHDVLMDFIITEKRLIKLKKE